MKTHSRARFTIAGLAFLALPTIASAAGVFAELKVATSSPDNALFANCANLTQPRDACTQKSFPLNSAEALGNFDPLQKHVEQFAGPNPAVASFAVDATAGGSASLGSLHAFASVQIVGSGELLPGRTPISGGGASARVSVNDTIKLESKSLAKGTPLTLEALFQVNGTGGGELFLNVRGAGTLENQRFGRFSDLLHVEDVAQDFGGESLANIGGQFTTFVGDILTVDYALEAFTRMTTTGWRPIDVLNGRANNSFYQNSAHLFFRVTDSALDVKLNNGTNFTYAFPTAVPLPPAAFMLLGALPLLGKRRKQQANYKDANRKICYPGDAVIRKATI